MEAEAGRGRDPVAPVNSPELSEGFAAFLDAAHRLERSYAALKARAEAVDLELARTNAELARTLEEREQVLAALPVGVLATDHRGAVRWINPEGRRLRDATERMGVALTKLRDGDHDVGGAHVRIRRVELPDGGQLVVVEDRTRLAGLEREVRRLDRLAGLSELALGVAHEIKNPLHGAMGFAALLERTDDPAKMRRHARRVIEGLRRVDRIVKALLQFARPSERMAGSRPLRDVAREGVIAAGVPETRVSVRGDLEEPVSPALVPVLASLVRNSVEAGATRVVVDARTGAEALVVEIRDDGSGIDPALGERVLEPFVSTKDQGTGLGLAMAARVAAYLGGALELGEHAGPGAVLRLRVPRLPAEPAPGESAGEVEVGV